MQIIFKIYEKFNLEKIKTYFKGFLAIIGFDFQNLSKVFLVLVCWPKMHVKREFCQNKVSVNKVRAWTLPKTVIFIGFFIHLEYGVLQIQSKVPKIGVYNEK